MKQRSWFRFRPMHFHYHHVTVTAGPKLRTAARGLAGTDLAVHWQCSHFHSDVPGFNSGLVPFSSAKFIELEYTVSSVYGLTRSKPV